MSRAVVSRQTARIRSFPRASGGESSAARKIDRQLISSTLEKRPPPVDGASSRLSVRLRAVMDRAPLPLGHRRRLAQRAQRPSRRGAVQVVQHTSPNGRNVVQAQRRLWRACRSHNTGSSITCSRCRRCTATGMQSRTRNAASVRSHFFRSANL